MREKSTPMRKAFLSLILALAAAPTWPTGRSGLTFVQPLQRAQIGMTPLRAVAEAEALDVDIAPADTEVFYGNVSGGETESAVIVGQNSAPLNVSRAASIKLQQFGGVQVECFGENGVVTGTRVAELLRTWHGPLSARLGGDVAVRPEMLIRDDGKANMRLHVAPVLLPQEFTDVTRDVLKAPADEDRINILSMALLLRTPNQKRAVTIRGIGATSINRIMKAIARANLVRLSLDPSKNVLWALPSYVDEEGRDGGSIKVLCLDIVLARQ